ncbi:MAG: hypothetical protein H6622_09985 [Halobacteriovoraceae bacterium]|nr:hypothetical protein [Halobacteriovoraceae bacterium]
MNTFHYLKVKFESLDIIAIEENLSSVNVSQRPCYVDASSINLEQLMELINNLATVFKYLNLHPKFPYPFYIITKLIENHETFPIVASENDLPTHFLQTAKRLTPRESMLQNKIQILQRRLININFYEKIEQLKEIQREQTKLSDTSKEEYFYHNILLKIKEQQKLNI